MSGTTFFRFNRVTILGGIIGCMFLPLIEFYHSRGDIFNCSFANDSRDFCKAGGLSYFGTQWFWVSAASGRNRKYAGYKLVSY